eukprot:564586-Pleurochrysis_carterae.AAC.1
MARTTSRTAIPASTAAAFGAAELCENGSAGAGCAPTWLRVDRGGVGGIRGGGCRRQGCGQQADGLRQPGPRRRRRCPLPHRVAGIPTRHGVV